MSITQGSPLPDVTVKTTKTDTAPSYYTDYLKGLASVGQQYTGTPAGADGSAAVPGRTAAQGIAGYDPMQTTGYGMVSTAADAYKPGLADARTTANLAAGGLDVTRIGQLMDPYRTNVVDEMARLSQQNIQRNVLPSLKAGFVGSGNLGSQRYAGALGQSLADVQANLTGQQYGALSKGYSEALKAAMDERELQNEAAKTQAGIAEKEQSLGLTGAGALTKAGAEKQLYEQSKLDYPLKTALEAAGLMRGLQVPMTQSESRVGPLAGAYSTSDLSNVLGIMTALGSMRAGSPGSDLIGGLGSMLRSITGRDWSSILGGTSTTADTVTGGADTDAAIESAFSDTSRGFDVVDPVTTTPTTIDTEYGEIYDVG